jgi:hypothetical protein
MKLKIEKLQEVAFYPDVEGNLALPENERFTIHLKKQSAFRLMDCYTSIDGTMHIDKGAYIQMTVQGIDNPPILQFGKTEREATIEDIVTLPELADIAATLWAKAVEVNTARVDAKKS